jgi:DNA transposition AAA+ family ATPase
MENDREKYRAISIDERIELVENLFINHPSFERCFKQIEECHQYSKISSEPQCLLITGEEPGVGKTTLCEQYLALYPRVELDEKTKVTILVESIPIPATPKTLVSTLLTEIGDPLPDKGTTHIQTNRLFNLIKECEVEIIILDEFHHFIDRDSKKVLYTVSDWLKRLITKTKIPVVLVGLPQSIKILEANSQLRRRFTRRGELRNFKWLKTPKPNKSQTNEKGAKKNDKDSDYRGFLKILDDGLPMAEASHLAGRVIAYRMWKATHGNVDRTMKLVRCATGLALRKGEEEITLEFLEEAYEKLFAGDSAKNPFAA